MPMPQCCYLAKGAKRPSHTTNTIKFDCIAFDQKVRPLSFRGNGNRTKEIELMELGLTCSKFLKRSCEIELISYFLKQELELIRYGNWN